jgi:hypothetical protein
MEWTCITEAQGEEEREKERERERKRDRKTLLIVDT